MVKGCPRNRPSAKGKPEDLPAKVSHTLGQFLGAQALAIWGYSFGQPGWAEGGLPWWAALRTLTGDVMRGAHRVGRGASIARGAKHTPATPAKVINCATTLHRSSSRASRHHRRASGWAEAPTDGGRAPRPAAQRRPHAAKSAQTCAPAETIARRGCGARRRRNERDPEGDAAAIDRPRHSETRGKWGNAAANAMEGPAGGACPGGGRER